jgi:hypothetical protein
VFLRKGRKRSKKIVLGKLGAAQHAAHRAIVTWYSRNGSVHGIFFAPENPTSRKGSEKWAPRSYSLTSFPDFKGDFDHLRR